MKKMFTLLLILYSFFISGSSYQDKQVYNNDEFYAKISKYKSFNPDKYNLYLTEYNKDNNIIYTLNKINHPTFLSSTLMFPSFSFDGGLFVNKSYYLSNNYIPNNLVPVTVNKITRKGETMLGDKIALKNLKELFNDASKNGINLTVFSAYRSYHKQQTIYQTTTNIEYVAKPGYSEHQTGLAFDIATITTGLSKHFETTTEYLYLSSNAYKYGFIERYPKAKEHITLYPYESWHYRYVGKDIAKIIYDENLTLEEYIYKYVELI